MVAVWFSITDKLNLQPFRAAKTQGRCIMLRSFPLSPGPEEDGGEVEGSLVGDGEFVGSHGQAAPFDLLPAPTSLWPATGYGSRAMTTTSRKHCASPSSRETQRGNAFPLRPRRRTPNSCVP